MKVRYERAAGDAFKGSVVHQHLPRMLTPEQKRPVLGRQATVWTEFISSVSHSEYMLLPRLPALADALWPPPAGSWPGPVKKSDLPVQMEVDYVRVYQQKK